MKKMIRITEENHRQLKVIAAQKGKTLEAVINEILARSLSKQKKEV